MRHVTCRDSYGNRISRHNCSSQAKPPSERSCSGDTCVHKWIESNWTNVSYWPLPIIIQVFMQCGII